MEKTDGRSARWAEHNQTRRAELVDATLRAIRHNGAGVGMEEIAAQAGTSKTVIYRHFVDRAGLYRAVVDKVDARIQSEMHDAMSRTDSLRDRLSGTLAAYLALTEADPEVYRFVVRPPALDGPLVDDTVLAITTRAAHQIQAILEPLVAGRNLDHAVARTWAVAIVGSVYACADRWLSDPDPMPREDLVGQLTDLAWDGLASTLNRSQPPDHSHPERSTETENQS